MGTGETTHTASAVKYAVQGDRAIQGGLSQCGIRHMVPLQDNNTTLLIIFPETIFIF